MQLVFEEKFRCNVSCSQWTTRWRTLTDFAVSDSVKIGQLGAVLFFPARLYIYVCVRLSAINNVGHNKVQAVSTTKESIGRLTQTPTKTTEAII